MKAIALIALLALSGCYYPTVLSRTVTVESDPEGKIVKRIETEMVTQQVSAKQIEFRWIKVEEALKERRESQ